MRLNALSPNLATIIEDIVNHEKLVQLLSTNEENPYNTTVSLPAYDLIESKVFPYPFIDESQTEKTTQIRVYYPAMKFKNRIIEDSLMQFDIVISNNLWLMFDENGRRVFKPLEIMKYLMEIFHEKQLNSVGKLNFYLSKHKNFNTNFNGYEMHAQILTIPSKC